LLAPHPTPKLEDHPLSAIRQCLFDIFAATFHIGGHSSICNLRMYHAAVTRTRLSRAMRICVQITPGIHDIHIPESGHRNWNFCYSFVSTAFIFNENVYNLL